MNLKWFFYSQILKKGKETVAIKKMKSTFLKTLCNCIIVNLKTKRIAIDGIKDKIFWLWSLLKIDAGNVKKQWNIPWLPRYFLEGCSKITGKFMLICNSCIMIFWTHKNCSCVYQWLEITIFQRHENHKTLSRDNI